MKPIKREREDIIKPLINGLRSSKVSSRAHCYSALKAILEIDKSVQTQQVLATVESVLKTDADNSKGEKRLVYAGKVLALGALIRANRVLPTDPEIVVLVFAELISQAMKKSSILIIATPFICQLLSSGVPETCVELLPSLFSNYSVMNSSLLEIALTAYKHQDFTSSLLDGVEEICNIVINDEKVDDTAYVELLFSHLVATSDSKFWETLIPKLNNSHVHLLCVLIEKSIEKRLPFISFVNREVLTLLLAVFRKQDTELHHKVKETFHRLFQWNVINFADDKKERRLAISIFFTGIPNVLHEYKFLNASLRQFLTFLTAKELDQVVDICGPLLQQSHRGRHTVSAINFLARIAQLKTTKPKTKIRIMKSLFTFGFCTKSDPEETQQFETAIQKSRDALKAILKCTYQIEVVNLFYDFVCGIIVNDGTIQISLVVQLANENLKEWIKLCDMSGAVGDVNIATCIKLHAFLLILDPSVASEAIEKLESACTGAENMSKSEKVECLMSIILNSAFDNKSILNYEALFCSLLKEELIQADSIQLLVDAIESENALNEVTDDEDSGSDDDPERDDENEESEKLGNNQFNAAGKDDQNGGTMNVNLSKKTTDEDNSDTESSIDMDDASETELNQMDLALSKVFSQKKEKGDKSEWLRNSVRTLRLIEFVLKRYKFPDAGIPLMLLMPCITCLIKCSKTKRGSPLLPRIMAVVKRLNGLKEVTGLENIDSDVMSALAEDIQKILKMRLAKDARKLLKGSIAMLSRFRFRLNGLLK